MKRATRDKCVFFFIFVSEIFLCHILNGSFVLI